MITVRERLAWSQTVIQNMESLYPVLEKWGTPPLTISALRLQTETLRAMNQSIIEDIDAGKIQTEEKDG